MGTTLIAAAPLDRRVGHQAMATPDGFCKRECPYMDVWQHPFYHHTAWCWKQMRDLGYYDGLIADCMHREPDERLARLPADMMPNVRNERPEASAACAGSRSIDGLERT